MGRPRKLPPIEELADEELPTSESQYMDFLEELGPDNIVCTISRYPKSGKDMEWCDDVPISDATLQNIRDHYGPGKYRLIFREGRLFRGQKTIKISDVYRPAVVTPSANGDGDKFYREMILAMIAAQRPPDMGALLTGLGAIMAGMKPTSNGDSPSALLTAVTGVFQTLKGKDESPTEKLRETMALINEFKDDKPAGGDNLYSVAKELGEKVIDAFSGPRSPAMRSPQPQAARPAIPPGAVPVSALPAAADAGPAAAASADEREQQMQKTFIEWIRVQLAFLKDKAKAGKDVEFWIAYIFENEEEPGCQAIIQAVERGATFEQLLTFDSEIASDPVLRAWFARFYEEVKSGLQEDMDSSRPGGNVPDTPVDEGDGAKGQSVPTSETPGGKPRKSARS